MVSFRHRLADMRRLGRTALDAYPLVDPRMRLVGDMENTTFRVEAFEADPEVAWPTPGGRARFLLRVHRPQRHGRSVDTVAAIRSELLWLTALRADTDLLVPEPLLTRGGDVTVTVSSAAVPETRTCSVLRWMDGSRHTAAPRPRHVRMIGAAMAGLHNHADEWSLPHGFVRIHWDWDAFFGDTMEYGGISALECWPLLPKDLRAHFDEVASRAGHLMKELGHGSDVVGLIHADLHLDNAIFKPGGVRLIDFDDCGFGYRLYDVAVTLWELRHRADYLSFHDAMVEGYTQHRPLPDDQLAHLDTFIATREVGVGLWFAGMAQVKSSFREYLDDELARIRDSLDVLLAN